MSSGSGTKKVAVLVLRNVHKSVSLDDMQLRYQHVGSDVQDVACFDLGAGNEATDRFTLAAAVLNADADMFSAVDGFVATYQRAAKVASIIDSIRKD